MTRLNVATRILSTLGDDSCCRWASSHNHSMMTWHLTSIPGSSKSSVAGAFYPRHMEFKSPSIRYVFWKPQKSPPSMLRPGFSPRKTQDLENSSYSAAQGSLGYSQHLHSHYPKPKGTRNSSHLESSSLLYEGFPKLGVPCWGSL